MNKSIFSGGFQGLFKFLIFGNYEITNCYIKKLLSFYMLNFSIMIIFLCVNKMKDITLIESLE